MIHAIHRRKPRRAVAAVEFAAVLPLILTLLLGIWEVGRLIEIQQYLSNAAREGARQAATGQLTDAQVQQVVIQTLAVEGLPTTDVVVTVQDLTTPANDVSAANYLDQIQITVTIPYSDVKFTLISMVTTPGELITSQVQWISMVDKPYPTAPTPPQG
ncbi:MAG TPA: TadE/TadG family type IV pilus assembly protein [Gemmataceae bacterium]|nr:TadE/TadG family type IV pilus assembly protein [Gemmataceae bacterium]